MVSEVKVEIEEAFRAFCLKNGLISSIINNCQRGLGLLGQEKIVFKFNLLDSRYIMEKLVEILAQNRTLLQKNLSLYQKSLTT